jgi:hypothetical protein
MVDSTEGSFRDLHIDRLPIEILSGVVTARSSTVKRAR